MRYIKQFGIIIAISFIGEVLHRMIPLPIPACIYGIIILFCCLMFKIIPLDSVKDVGKFLIEIMPILFIPAAVGVIEIWADVRGMLVPYILVWILTTVIVMAGSGLVTQMIVRIKRKKEDS